MYRTKAASKTWMLCTVALANTRGNTHVSVCASTCAGNPDHSLLGMLEAGLTILAAGHAETWLCGAPWTATRHAHYVDHALLGVLGADLRLLASGHHAEEWLRGAPRVVVFVHTSNFLGEISLAGGAFWAKFWNRRTPKDRLSKRLVSSGTLRSLASKFP